MIYYTLTSIECDYLIRRASMHISVVKNEPVMFKRSQEILISIYQHQIELLKERKEILEIRDQE